MTKITCWVHLLNNNQGKFNYKFFFYIFGAPYVLADLSFFGRINLNSFCEIFFLNFFLKKLLLGVNAE